MADRYTSKMGVAVRELPGNLDDVLSSMLTHSRLDRVSPVAGSEGQACEVAWGGRMQRAVIRSVEDDGVPLLRVEAYIGQDGFPAGFRRQAELLQVLMDGYDTTGDVHDLAARTVRDADWLARVVAGQITYDDVIVTRVEGTGVRWAATHGAARFGIPDLELYGLTRDEVEPAVAALTQLHQQLLARGIQGTLTLPTGEPVYLVPVRDAWMKLPLDWPGIGRAGQVRGPGLDGPRATVSVLHKKRFGRYRYDFAGVRRALNPR